MSYRNYKVKLDSARTKNNKSMSFYIGDYQSNRFTITITDNGNAVELSQFEVVLLSVSPSNTLSTQFIHPGAGNVLTVDLEEHMMNEVGIWSCKTVLIKEDFTLVLDPIAYTVNNDELTQLGADISQQEQYPVLIELLGQNIKVQDAEEQRILNEAQRILAEDERKANELERMNYEIIRQHEESDRHQYEAQRRTVEQSRVLAENTRQQQEELRQLTYTQFNEQEQQRQANASQLINDTTNTVNQILSLTDGVVDEFTEDANKALADFDVQSNAKIISFDNYTADAQQAEETRIINEQARILAEQSRVNGENTRIANEQQREKQEQERQASTQQCINDCKQQCDIAANILEGEVDAKKSELDSKANAMQTQVNNKILEIENRFNELSSNGESSAEVIDARDGEASLKARLDRDVEKAKEIYVDIKGSSISTDSNVGYAKDVEILGNTIQDATDLADIRSVGDKVEGQELYEIPVLSRGKNLFNERLQYGTWSVYTGELTLGTQGNICNKEHVPIYPNREYTLYCNFSRDVWVLWYDVNKNFISYTLNCALISPPNSRYMCFYIVNGTSNNTININDIVFQLEEGTVATPYEPYQEDKLTILSPVQLEKVGDVADRIICKDGVWGVEKNIEKHILNGGEDWVKENNYYNYNKKYDPSYSYLSSLICNRFPEVKYTEWDIGNKITGIDIIYGIRIRTENFDNETLADFKKSLQENNVIVYYNTQQTPQFIPLPHDQQVKLRTFASKTNIHFETEIEGTIKAQVPKSLGATVNTHTEQINNLNKELDRVKKLEESTVSTVTTESNFATVEETSNGYFEDVKLEGKTLVNKILNNRKVLRGLEDTEIKYVGYQVQVKPSTEYTVVLSISKNTSSPNTSYIWGAYIDAATEGSHNICKENTSIINVGGALGVYALKFTTKDSITNSPRMTIGLHRDWGIYEFEADVMLLEGDHTNNPPSYFEGLKSVGDGVEEVSVASVNENLFDRDTCKYNTFTLGDGEESPNSNYVISDFIKVNGNTSYYVEGLPVVIAYDSNKNYIKYIRNVSISDTFTTDFNCSYVKIRNWSSLGSIELQKEAVNSAYLIKGTTPKPYTPHQSDKKRLLYYNNETQTWEKPILRQWDSIEKHSDGKYYYHKRSEEVVLNGSEGWGGNYVFENTGRWVCQIPNMRENSLLVCDKFINKSNNDDGAESVFATSKLLLTLSNDKGNPSTWLQANNVTVVYQLAQEEVYECTNLDLITYPNETNYIVDAGVITPKTTLKVVQNAANIIKQLQEKVSILEGNQVKFMQIMLDIINKE